MPAGSSSARGRRWEPSMGKTFKVCTLPGDGIGPEIMAEAKKVLAAIGERFDVAFACEDALIGGSAIDATGGKTALPEETLDAARASDAVLLAAVGGPKWDDTSEGAVRPEQGLLGIRKELGLFCNLRPVRIFSSLAGASPLRPDLLEGVDLLIVRELTGGMYFGEHARTDDGARDTCVYSASEIERVVRRAFDAARGRRGHVTSVDKANVLETSRLWREIAAEVAGEYPDVEFDNMYVDNAAMQLVANPAQFDVMVTENTFGDILSDEASMLTGSLGMLASASLGTGTALYEPSHGSAPDIAGRGVANPLAQLLSVELMLRTSFGLVDAADALSGAIERVLDDGWRTADIADDATPADRIVGTSAMGDKVIAAL